MNVRTLPKETKRNELVSNLKTHTMPILGIVNHKILYQHVENSTFITSSFWRNTNNVSSGGEGLIINRRAYSALAKVESRNKRIIVANFNRNPALTMIVHFSPVEGSNEAEEHYNKLVAAVKDVRYSL